MKSWPSRRNAPSAKLDPRKAKTAKIDKLEMDEKKFRWLLNENAMAYEKDGRRNPEISPRRGEAGEIRRQ